jgi:hypothetical protein
MAIVMSACGVFGGSALMSAEIPHLIRYQGQAVDSQGVPFEGPYTLTFRLYDAQTAGTKLWEEAQPNVPLQGGHFSVLLGQVIPLETDWSKALWVSVQVGSDPELAPRQQITSVPLAIMAKQLEGPLQVVGENVGIGTTNPGVPLDIANGTGVNPLGRIRLQSRVADGSTGLDIYVVFTTGGETGNQACQRHSTSSQCIVFWDGGNAPIPCTTQTSGGRGLCASIPSL